MPVSGVVVVGGSGRPFPADLRSGQVWIGWAEGGPPVQAQFQIVPKGAQDPIEVVVTLGEVFSVGEEVWRFADLDFESPRSYHAVLRQVDDDESLDPPTGRIWYRTNFDFCAGLPWSQIDVLEARLGQKLPDSYRRWLWEHNGGLPGETYPVYRQPFVLSPERPLLGMHPHNPPMDLLTAQRDYRDRYLTRDYLVVAILPGDAGLLVIKLVVDWGVAGSVWFLPADAMAAEMEPQERTGDLVRVAADFTEFIDWINSPPPPSPLLPDLPKSVLPPLPPSAEDPFANWRVLRDDLDPQGRPIRRTDQPAPRTPLVQPPIAPSGTGPAPVHRSPGPDR